jgi:hypothetical protein
MNETEDEKCVCTACAKRFLTMERRSVVSSLCVGLAETINKVGPGFLDGSE